ncbi:MAG TPA: UvrD-helicase domain-containing protein [Baekduia sp.]|nr:UvrD-helicase domain-containing protein [Baekduia sp.]
MSTRATAFDPSAPLSDGVTVLEASAGTGKTYTIAALATRAVALDGLPLDRLLAVTFTRAATGELRDRIRERLARSERLLREGRTAAGDEVDALLATGTDAEVRKRCARLRTALADFDAATIVTLHGFCQTVLSALGVAGDLDPDPTVVEEVNDLREQVVLDLYLRRFRKYQPMFDLTQARRIVKAAVELPDVVVYPPDASDTNNIPQSRARLASAARNELDARKRHARLLTFDDLLVRLRDALIGDGGDALCERLRARWELVLVDEFQDTDRLQWEVLERAFAGAGRRLVLIGDPKQAIYAFRGADVQAYLGAADGAVALHTLDINWRSDQALIGAYDALFGGAQLGHERIVYRKVRARHVAPRLHDTPDPAALRVRVLDRYAPNIARTEKTGVVQVDSARAAVAADCARDISALLASGAEVEHNGIRLPVQPGDVAVLCRRTDNAQKVYRELERLGVPVVLAGAGNVFDTAAATHWLRFLEALERPAYEGAARVAALTPFLGWDAERLAAATPADLEGVHGRLHRWARLLRMQGVAALAEAITVGEQLPARVLASAGGERALTDLRHVAELLHRAGTTDGLGATALATWLRHRIADARVGDADQDHARRLESDHLAVQVLTVHRSKGLEFPIVYLPDLWEAYRPQREQLAAFHDPSGRRGLDVGLIGREYQDHVRAKTAEERAEELRLLYVALTRARHQTVMWWAGTQMAGCAPLARLLLDRDESGAVGPGHETTPSDEAMTTALTALAAQAPGRISVAMAPSGTAVPFVAPAAPAADLEVRRFARPLDRAWRRTSYSALAAGAKEHRVPVGTETEENLLADEPVADDEELTTTTEDASALARMPAGREIGTVFHRVLEQADFTVDDLPAELSEHLEAAIARAGVDIGAIDDVAGGLAAALAAPLGPVLDGRALTAIAPADRLDELVFELPLAGGDRPSGQVTLGRIAKVLQERLADGDPVRPYADLLATPGLDAPFRGYLTGSIDLVCRWRTEDGRWRFALADYKTNRLPDYGQATMLAEMQDKHYLLQALIYLVALHRHLRARLADYDADRDLAGAAYLFVRGMGAGADPGDGVVAWRPSGELLDALSEVFDG